MVLLMALAGVSLSACAIRPYPLEPEVRLARVEADRTNVYADQEPVDGPITIYEAIARALKYNLDSRLALMEQVLQTRQLSVEQLDLLPELAANAGVILRSNENASSSESIITRQQSLEPSTSEDQGRGLASLSFSFNLLDFGVSYFEAKQQADRVLIAAERRRRVVANVVQEVRTAFWQAAAAQGILPQLGPVIAEAEEALANARSAEEQRLGNLEDNLKFQKSLVETLRQLRALQSDLTIAKARMASLINLPPGTDYSVQVPDQPQLPSGPLAWETSQLEELALYNRAELREEDYQKRISALEVRKAFVRILPGLTLTGDGTFDTNSFLVHNYWAEAGARVTQNLIGLATLPINRRLAKAQVELAEARRLAVSVAVITQVNIAKVQFGLALKQFEQASELNRIEQELFRLTQAGARAASISPLDRIRGATSAVSAELERARGYAELQVAMGNLFQSLGLDPLPDTIADDSIDTLAAAIEQVSLGWEAGRLPVLPGVDDTAQLVDEVPAEPVLDDAAVEDPSVPEPTGGEDQQRVRAFLDFASWPATVRASPVADPEPQVSAEPPEQGGTIPLATLLAPGAVMGPIP